MASPGSTERALLVWINSLSPSLGIPPISSLGDVADGISLSRILVDIDREYFGSSAIEPALSGAEKPSFIAAVRNLKRLYKALSTYYIDTLHLGDLDDSLTPNVSLIAKDASIEETVKLVRLILVVCVSAETKCSEYVGNIERMSDVEARDTLLELIRASKHGSEDKKDGIATEYDIEALIQSEVTKVLARYDPLERAYAELQEHNSALQESYDKLKQHNVSLQEQVKQATGMSKLQVEIADNKAKSQIEYLQNNMQELEEQLMEKDKKIVDSETKTKELVVQVSGLLLGSASHGRADSYRVD
ncbi:hypothetical protein V1517DRAFT_252856 [Lipomyces orientalis]|uniref:Uncharacterized protein n=1 Tax=Lipomyces orientalis TaxID=1233043 RepID=A0ACC3TYP5_9ASCO